jgi:diacylglycerol kinase
MGDISHQKDFSLTQRARSFAHAGRGVWLFVRTTHNAWVQIATFIAAIILGFDFGITSTEWMFLVLAGSFVLVAEAFNTAIEIDMNLTSPELHPYARDAKDVAAGAVLIASMTALAVGVLIFGPHVF